MKNNKLLKISFLFLLTIFLNFSISAQNNKPEKVKAVKTITGKFTKFVVGDFVHAIVKKPNGKTQDFFLIAPKFNIFWSKIEEKR